MWIVQDNLISESQYKQFIEALQNLGIKYKPIQIIPFSDFLPEVKVDDSIVIPYGSTTFIRLAYEDGWKGVFFDHTTFKSSVWIKERRDMLNQDAKILSIKDTCEFLRKEDPEEMWFVRPDDDFKYFPGSVVSSREFIDWVDPKMDERCIIPFEIDVEKIISIAPAKNIQYEWRYFIVGGKIVDGSVYRIGGQLHQVHEDDKEVNKRAQELADIWLPHENVVMDLALVNDELKVTEFNCLNASGYYKNDIAKIIKAVDDYMRNKYGMENN